MKMIKLNMADGIEHVEAAGEDDGPTQITRERFKPVVIAVDQIRNFYARKGDREGTRIMFRNGSACPVKETLEQVEAAIQSA